MPRPVTVLSLALLALAGCGGGGDGDSGDEPQRLPGAPDDAATVVYALRVERLEQDLYRRALDLPFFSDDDKALLRTIARHEDEHVTRLEAALRRLRGREGRAPVLKAPLTDRATVLALAYRLENLGAAAYLGQVDRIRDRALLEDWLAIQTVEGRHAAAVGALIGKTATPDGAVGAPANMATVERVLTEVTA